jgi:thiosulfate dehydrogenase [quinone] large subunit
MFKKLSNSEFVWAMLRISVGLIFLWAFFDKTLGLGYATKEQNAWVHGKSPTYGYLTNSTKGPLKEFFMGLAGSSLVDWIFMMGLLGIGAAMLFGIGITIAGYSGMVMMLLMWVSAFPPSNHPFIDDHIIYAIVMVGLTTVKSGHWLGLGKWWENLSLVKKFPWLR